MESRTIHVVATGDGYIVRRQRIVRSPGYYQREDSTHPVATEEEVAGHLDWLVPPADVVQMPRRRRRSAGDQP